MNVRKRTLVYIVIFICVSFFSCEKKDAPVTDAVSEVPEGTPVITEHPKSASYPTNEIREQLTVKVSVRESYGLSYQWYVMRYVEDYLHRNATAQEISIEVDKLINDLEGSQFRKMDRQTGQNCSTLSDIGQAVYICIVTSTPLWGGEPFTAVSDPAVILIFPHPLTDWYTADKSAFAYRIYWSEISNRYMDLRDIAYGNGYFVAVGDRYDDKYINRPIGLFGIIAYSNDGRTWELIKDNPFGDYGITISAIAYGNGRFIAVGTGGKIAYSIDIKTWIPVESIVSEYFWSIVYGNGSFVASFGSGLVSSRDGETWASVEGFDASRVSCIAYGNNRFIAGTHDGKISFSDDGKTWVTVTDNMFDTHAIVTIAYGNGRYLAFARKHSDRDPPSYKMGYSDDGETWVAFTPSKNWVREWNWIEEIIYSEGVFVAVGGDKTAYSKDGINWNDLGESYQRSYFNHPLDGIRYNAVAYGDGSFVAVSNNGIIRYCQWPIVKALAPVITYQPRWPSSRARIHQDDTGASYTVPTLNIEYETVSFGIHSTQWYRNDTDNTVGGVPIEGANSWDYAPDISKPGTTYYYAKAANTIPDYFNVEARNREASVTSNTVAVTVDIPEEAAVQEVELEK